jgi:hypothetical protein
MRPVPLRHPTMLRRIIQIALAAAMLLRTVGPAAGQEPSSAPVEYIDHIMIRSDNPGELYRFFSETLQLPVAWPLADRGGVVSGGVGFGNVNIEAIKFPNQTSRPAPTHLVGFAFKPSLLAESLEELDRRGIPYGPPRPFFAVGPDGRRSISFTNVTLQEFSDSDQPADATIQVFLSEYNPAYVDAEQRRDRLRHELATRNGGPLGLIRVEEIVVATADLAVANRAWEKLAAPIVSGDRWQIGDGPAIRLVPGETNMLQAVVLAVASLAKARAFLKQNELLGTESETQLTIAPSRIRGIDIRLVGEP